MHFSRGNFLHTLAYSGTTAAMVPSAWAGLSPRPSGFGPARLGEPSRVIRLNSNENAYGPSEKSVAAMRSALLDANRYPYMEYEPLEESIAKQHGVERKQVLIGCGSTEILRMAGSAFLGPGQTTDPGQSHFRGHGALRSSRWSGSCFGSFDFPIRPRPRSDAAACRQQHRPGACVQSQ